MYLTDKDYLKDDFYKEIISDPTDESAIVFKTEQIQPSSIDLRLSNKIWLQKKVWRGKIDVSKNGVFDFIASKYWKDITISEMAPLILKPNETVFGRTHEVITIPENYAGKIEANSSIARLSISITYSDYCNPKYRGHFPLQIHNTGKNAIIFYPYMGICQLMLVKLSNTVETAYDNPNRQSIYAVYDDGNPVKWWASKTLKGMRTVMCERYGNKSIDNLLDQINNLITIESKDTYEQLIYKRLDKFLGKNKETGIKSTKNTYTDFISSEKEQHNRDKKIIAGIYPFAFTLTIAIIGFSVKSLMSLTRSPIFFGVIYIIATIIVIYIIFTVSTKIHKYMFERISSYLTLSDIKNIE